MRQEVRNDDKIPSSFPTHERCVFRVALHLTPASKVCILHTHYLVQVLVPVPVLYTGSRVTIHCLHIYGMYA